MESGIYGVNYGILIGFYRKFRLSVIIISFHHFDLIEDRFKSDRLRLILDKSVRDGVDLETGVVQDVATLVQPTDRELEKASKNRKVLFVDVPSNLGDGMFEEPAGIDGDKNIDSDRVDSNWVGDDELRELTEIGGDEEDPELGGVDEEPQNSGFNVGSILETDDLLSEMVNQTHESDDEENYDSLMGNTAGVEVENQVVTAQTVGTQEKNQVSHMDALSMAETNGIQVEQRKEGGHKKCVVRPNLVLQGVDSKKRIIQVLTPRRKQAPRIGEGLYLGKVGDGHGNKGGKIPPNNNG